MIFSFFKKIAIVFVFSIINMYGSDMCPAVIDGGSVFMTASTYSRTDVYIDRFDADYYYFDIQTAGTLTVTVTSGGNKVDLAYSDTACPTASGTGVRTKVVTTTSPMDFNIALYATNDAEYTITATFVPAPLSIIKTSTPTQVAVNTPTAVNYKLAVKNNGAAILNNVRVMDTFPSGLAYTIGNVSASGWNCSVNAQSLDCNLSAGSLAVGATAPDINISTLANIASSVTNTATASATGYTASSSSVLQAVSGAGTVDLEIQKFASSDVIPPNTNFAYLIFVINYDNDDAQLVKVTDTFPADENVSFISAGGNGWTCTTPTDANRTFVCNYGASLPKGITYFLVDAHTGANEVANVSNTATVSALNTINYNHSVTDDANITISTQGSSGSSFFTGYYPEGGSIEVSDLNLALGANRNGAQIWTKIAATQDTTFPVYFVNPSTGAVMDYNGTNQDVPLTVIFKLTDETCSAANETYLSYDSTKSVIAEFDNGYGHVVNAKTKPDTTFDLRNIAKKNSRLVMKYVNTQGLLDASGESCANSSLSGNIPGLPQCIANSVGGNLDNNKYINVFGIDAFVRCAIGNGQPCNAANHGVGDDPYNTEYGCYECTVGGSGYCSKDNFAIRPKAFDLNITAASTLKAQVNNLAFKGLTNNSTPVVPEYTLDYNESQDTSFAVDINISNPSKTCAQMNLTISPSVAFQNGLDLRDFRFSNIGDVNLTIHDINGAEFGKIDENDTNPTTSRFITPFTVSYRIIPHHFGLDGNYTNAANGFTYLSNFEEYNTTASRKMSALLDLNITAQADNNTTTTNYTENCYAKDGNLTTGITPFTISPAGSLSKMIWYDLSHDTNGSIPLPLPATVSIPILHTAFDSNESNGTASVNYLINFDRNQTKLVNPFSVTVGNVDMNDSDSVAGSKAMNTSAYFVYGHIMPRDMRVFGENTPFTANAWYEVYNASTIGATVLLPSKNDASWYTNILHNDVNDGDGNVTRIQTNGAAAAVSPLFDANTFTAGVETYSETAGWPLNGYKAHIDTDPWLWYGVNALQYVDPATGNLESACLTHPCFNINVVPAIGATGSAKSGAESKKASKKSTSEAGGTGWKSTSDYAPAIR